MTETILDDKRRKWRIDWWGSPACAMGDAWWIATATRGAGPRRGQLGRSALQAQGRTESEATDAILEKIMPSRERMR